VRKELVKKLIFSRPY